MLKFMGADTSLTPSQAKVLLEVSVVPIYSSFLFVFLISFVLCLHSFNLLFQDEKVGFAYISHRDSRPSLCESQSLSKI